MGGAEGDAMETQGFTNQQDSQPSEDAYVDESIAHLEKMGDYKSYAKGLMDIALMSANANQLRTAIGYPQPYSAILIGLISASLLLQVIASLVLLFERMTCRKGDYQACHKYNLAISILVVLIIFINVFVAAFGFPEATPSPTNSTNI